MVTRAETENSSPIRAGQYQGPTDRGSHERGIAKLNEQFAGSNRSLSRHIVNALERAVSSGRQQVGVFDVGSGIGTTMLDLKYNGEVAHTLSKFLKRNPGVRLTVHGLTDAPSPDLHLQPREWTLDQLEGIETFAPIEQITLENDYFSLARRANQTMAHYLREKGITSLDLLWFSQSAQYLSARVFKETIEALWNVLEPGGVILMAGISGPLKGYKGFSNRQLVGPPPAAGTPTRIDIIRENTTPIGQSDMNFFVLQRAKRQANLEQERAATQQVLAMYIQRGVLKDGEFEAFYKEALTDPAISPESQWHVAVNNTLGTAHQRLVARHKTDQHQQKIDTLFALPGATVINLAGKYGTKWRALSQAVMVQKEL